MERDRKSLQKLAKHKVRKGYRKNIALHLKNRTFESQKQLTVTSRSYKEEDILSHFQRWQLLSGVSKSLLCLTVFLYVNISKHIVLLETTEELPD